MFEYNISFIDNLSNENNIEFPIPQCDIHMFYGLDNKRYIGFICDCTEEEKQNYLIKFQQINSDLNSNFVVTIIDNDNSNLTPIKFINFYKLIPSEIQEHFNIFSIENNNNLTARIELSCEVEETGE